MADWGGHSDPSEPRLPRRLADDLGELYRPPATVPPEVDAEILESAGVRCREARVRRQIRFWGWVGVVVAILCVAVWVYRLWERLPPKPPPAVDSLTQTAGDHGTTVTQSVPVPEGTRYETTVEG